MRNRGIFYRLYHVIKVFCVFASKYRYIFYCYCHMITFLQS